MWFGSPFNCYTIHSIILLGFTVELFERKNSSAGILFEIIFMNNNKEGSKLVHN